MSVLKTDTYCTYVPYKPYWVYVEGIYLKCILSPPTIIQAVENRLSIRPPRSAPPAVAGCSGLVLARQFIILMDNQTLK